MYVAHYLNQFFGGIGAEEHAGEGLQICDSAVGSGKLLESALGNDVRVVVTFICGDNYAVEHQDELTTAVLAKLRTANIDLFVAGPCFDAGRYGMAAAALCRAVQKELSIPVVTAMSEENPGVDLYRDALYIIDSGASVARLRDVIVKMAALSKKLLAKLPIGLPDEDGYLQRGWLRDQLVEQRAATRLVDMLLAKMTGKPFRSEMPATSFAPVPIPAAVKNLSKAK
ncbi:MAG TPA: glycine/betaine/sarcosine/D-proline family reductase selenoprotein B, partial [Candidatus Binatia bacterium]|nr:glycine/betaine/sarcosine/D-proline family reductase selenoprotein B [Candidatus Binatia bacterium]